MYEVNKSPFEVWHRIVVDYRAVVLHVPVTKYSCVQLCFASLSRGVSATSLSAERSFHHVFEYLESLRRGFDNHIFQVQHLNIHGVPFSRNPIGPPLRRSMRLPLKFCRHATDSQLRKLFRGANVSHEMRNLLKVNVLTSSARWIIYKPGSALDTVTVGVVSAVPRRLFRFFL